ncbi:MAG: hypothetical protein ACLFPL_03795 [Candidatus Nanoarchaeia archaeon]
MTNSSVNFYCFTDEGKWKKTYSLLHNKINENLIENNSFVLFKYEGWNDYGFISNFDSYYYVDKDNIHSLGVIRIIQKEKFETFLPEKFNQLPKDTYFSRIPYESKKIIKNRGIPEIIFKVLTDVEENKVTSNYLRDLDNSGNLESGFISSLFRDEIPSYISTDQGSVARNSLNELKIMLKLQNLFEDTTQLKIYHRMIFGNCITILESYLSDIIIHNIMNNEIFFKNFLTFDNFAKDKISMEEIGNSSKPFEVYLKNKVYKKLSNISFHNVNYTQKLFKHVLNVEINLARFSSDIIKRNHIFHRNGKEKDGNEMNISADDIYFLINRIEEAINLIEKKIAFQFTSFNS